MQLLPSIDATTSQRSFGSLKCYFPPFIILKLGKAIQMIVINEVIRTVPAIPLQILGDRFQNKHMIKMDVSKYRCMPTQSAKKRKALKLRN